MAPRLVSMVVGALLAPLASAVSLRSGSAAAPADVAVHTLVSQNSTHMKAQMDTELGPFNTVEEACDYCFSSFTKAGIPPAGPVNPACVCMVFPEAIWKRMWCATPVSAAALVKKRGGCRCKARDMEAMGKTTCEKL
mmetsp:Transcript_81047/g.225151  ORF Transcript_81047/g.225151 Transcript_81047/m.225151 type:complete len:137 (+) Transcript_81047:95-505(+)|eukprot:CAMPEP_0176204248 /NCGR_PEP_ID=MMETSP0121_2-20121125/10991_1 /TAXON_ID=160619 /ORGANISM="Kryptoperidinium foliaceum, Strain CCMP 1326" /LENGTH=136 /DNA_ID=CAMNT_0017543165 /DNA_START=92 /DNA_END=502 /DNA_ORIENTATION=-